MYSLVDFGSMLTDRVRVEAFHKALQDTVRGKRVLEIGGGTGFFACLASALGAAHVTSIERNSLITHGPALARANGLSDIEFVLGSSQHFGGPDRYDIIIHDLRGNTPFFERSMATLRDASRLLNPGGQFLPRRDRVYAALVEDPEAYRDMEGVWGTELSGLDLTPLRGGTHRRLRYEPSSRASHWEPQLLADVEYSDPREDEAETLSEFVASHQGVSHGVVVWFDTELTEQVGFTTNPWAPAQQRGTTYGVVFLPWPKPIAIEEGREYHLRVGLDTSGRAQCQLSQKLGSSIMLLGSFAETRARSNLVQLPTDFRFVPHPLLSAYRAAFQGMEKGEKVPKVVQRIRDSCKSIQSEEAASRILVKCVDLTQVRAKRGRERVTWLRFGKHRIRLVTNFPSIREAALKKLSPSWKPTRSKTGEPLEIRFQRVLTAEGPAYSISVDERSHPFYNFEEALTQLELLVLRRGLLTKGAYVHLEVNYVIREGLVHLQLDRTDQVELCLLDHQYRLAPYATSGGTLEHRRPLPISRIEGAQEASPAMLVSLLIQRCRNLSALPDPLAYFSELVKTIDPRA